MIQPPRRLTEKDADVGWASAQLQTRPSRFHLDTQVEQPTSATVVGAGFQPALQCQSGHEARCSKEACR